LKTKFETIILVRRSKADPSGLLSEGKTKEEAMKLIGCAVAVEIFKIVKHQKPFNESRYVINLSNLPKIPWEE